MIAQSARVVFAHGKESGPWGTKITALAEVARAHGWAVDSVDYRGLIDPRARLARLLALQPQGAPLVLAGSSMGGWVSAMACAALKPAGLFLMAPALYFPGYDEEPAELPAQCTVVHGWHDEVVPVDRALRFARQRSIPLHLLDADHGLNSALDLLGLLLVELLQRCSHDISA